MKVANLAGRLTIVTDSGAIDVEQASGGGFDADPQAIYVRWDEFTQWAAQTDLAGGGRAYSPLDLGAPAPRPSQIFAVGFNYRSHAQEFGTTVAHGPPPVFTKFASSITGPFGSVALPEGSVDWEIELVAVIGRRGWQVDEVHAWRHIAGLAVGQDLSERETQLRGSTPQFSLGKSYPAFAPMGPWIVTLDEIDDPDDLRLTCTLNGDIVQDARTSQMIAPLPALVAQLSCVVPLLPGDVIYTGTPAGVGMGRQSPRFLRPGDELASRIEGIGDMQHTMIAANAKPSPAQRTCGGHLT
ncbi:fumarylacetoacetate hydrolase family protein [Mycobacterium sp. 1081908.1]|uniref:fumarylacetoacetate hydrolase family protein n=1 Tax=Mycobacterium sp. 1081908.1 TaxID=1834066 RepID=UPI0007FF284F|nr:fumarylacetoacetate hydrolase family protein [Mycobacterium sp. 1081908.1]OBK43149.1 fumarylacetoacetate hydrolase [Mycobacterium sp. 1081908.1]